MKEPLKILGVSSDDAAFYYRVLAPFGVLDRSTDHTWHVKRATMADADKYGVLWIHQSTDPFTFILARQFKDSGKSIVYDLDDWLFQYPPSWAGFDELSDNRLAIHANFIRLADLVTVPTEYLARKICETVADVKVKVLPNCILAGDWDMIQPKIHNLDGPVLGWFGTNHWDDFFEIAPTIERALEYVNGYLMLIGPRELARCFSTKLIERTMFQSMVPMKSFAAIREMITSFDVGLCWATDRTESSKCRSPLKMYQCMAAGVPVVASANVYSDDKEAADKAGFIARDVSELYDALVSALELKGTLKLRAQEAYNFVMSQRSYEARYMNWASCLDAMRCQSDSDDVDARQSATD